MSDLPIARGAYPRTRMRRNRRDAWSRDLVRENYVTPSDLIWPVFVQDGKGKRTSISSMPGVARVTVDELVKDARRADKLKIPAIAIFPFINPKLKTPEAEEAYNADNLVCRAVRAVKKAVPEIGIICDAALDPFTSHGHDGLIRN